MCVCVYVIVNCQPCSTDLNLCLALYSGSALGILCHATQVPMLDWSPNSQLEPLFLLLLFWTASTHWISCSTSPGPMLTHTQPWSPHQLLWPPSTSSLLPLCLWVAPGLARNISKCVLVVRVHIGPSIRELKMPEDKWKVPETNGDSNMAGHPRSLWPAPPHRLFCKKKPRYSVTQAHGHQTACGQEQGRKY